MHDRPSQPSADAKLDCFEAIRGLAAFIIVIAHMILGFCPALYFRVGPRWEELPFWLQCLARFPGKFLWNGEVLVEMFFVLSGFVLSWAYFQKGAAILPSATVRRFPRLMLPVLGSALVAFLFLQSGTMLNQQAVHHMDELQGLTYDPTAASDDSNNWLRGFFDFNPNLLDAIWEGVWGAFVGPSCYNPVLWTMSIEMAGSFLVYGFLAIFGNARRRWLLYILLSVAVTLLGYWRLIDFVGGIALCDLWTVNQRTWRRALPLWSALALVAIAIFLVPWRPVAALLIVGATAASPRLQHLLSARWLCFLGRISFGLYLLHMPIFCSLCCALYSWLCRDLGWAHAYGAILASTVGMMVMVPAAWLFYIAIDRPAVTVARWLDGMLFGRRASPASQVPVTVAISKAA